MAVLIDQPLWTFRGEKWSHMVSDSDYDELHDIANLIGIRRVGFQGDHYDLPARLLPAALSAGATQVDSRILVKRLRSAGLRKPRSYEGWTTILRRDATSVDEADNDVADFFGDSDHPAKHILATCQEIWGVLRDQKHPLHQLFVLRRPGQLAVAVDTDLAAKSSLEDVAGRVSPTQVWITGGNPRLAVDILIDHAS